MEMALAALASLGTAGAAAGGAGVLAGAGGAAAGASALAGGAAAGGGGLLGALGSSSVLSILGGATTAVSVLQQLGQGEMRAQQAEMESGIAKNEAIGARATGLQRQAQMERALLKTMGENEVAYAASGIDISYGEAATSRSRTLDRGSGEIQIDLATSDAQVAGLEAKSLGYSRMARQFRTGALLGALASAGEGLLKIGRRGVPV